jgi:transcriptional regulator with XRE-family HTH domain
MSPKPSTPSAWTGADLRAARERLGLSQAALAERLGIDRVSVARMEIGTRAIRLMTQRAVEGMRPKEDE